VCRQNEIGDAKEANDRNENKTDATKLFERVQVEQIHSPACAPCDPNAPSFVAAHLDQSCPLDSAIALRNTEFRIGLLRNAKQKTKAKLTNLPSQWKQAHAEVIVVSKQVIQRLDQLHKTSTENEQTSR